MAIEIMIGLTISQFPSISFRSDHRFVFLKLRFVFPFCGG